MPPAQAPAPNAYGAAPNASYAPVTSLAPSVHRSGGALVAQRGATLDGACVKCGAPHAPHLREVNLRYAPSWVYMMLLLSPVIAAGCYLGVGKQSRHRVAICDRCIGAWDNSVRESAMSGAAAVCSVFAGTALVAAGAWASGATMMMLGPVFALTAAVVARKKRLTTSLIDEQKAHIEGVSLNYERAAPQRMLPPGT